MKKTQQKTETTPVATLYLVGDPDTEDINMTREEYIALKQHLTTMRGLAPVPPDATPVLAQFVETAITDLALEEDEVGSLARRILRMRRDKAPDGEISRLAVPLLESIAISALKAGDADPKTGLTFVPIKETPQLKAILRKLRKSAA
jgi:hypothetical protein